MKLPQNQTNGRLKLREDLEETIAKIKKFKKKSKNPPVLENEDENTDSV